jgi:uncharacterized membrane protein YbhN (UPF0104 family)
MPALRKIAATVLFCAGLVLAGGLFRQHLDTLNWATLQFRPGWLALAFTANLAYIGLYAVLWQQLAETGGLRLPPATARGISFCALAYKYLPVRVAGIGYRAWAYHSQGGWPVTLVIAVLYGESALVLFSGGMIVLLSSPWVSWQALRFGSAPLLLCSAALLGLWVLPAALARLARARPGWQWLLQAAEVAQTSLTLGLLIRYAGAWMLLGTGLWLTLAALDLPLSSGNWIVCVWAYALAGLAGMIAIFAPSGLGVREGVLALALCTILPPAAAALAALAARILIMAAEALCAVLGHRLMQKATPLRPPASL